MKRYIYALPAVAALLAAGCAENEMERYRNNPAVYFHWSSEAASQHDSINYSFFPENSSVTEHTLWIRVNSQGFPADYDRPVSIVQTNAGKPNAAVAGTHFKPFDLPEIKERMVIPAGEPYGMVPIVLLRDGSLDLATVRLEISVEKNEHFLQGVAQWRNFVVTVTNMAEKPRLWEEKWQYVFGPTWGSRKFRFIIDCTGYTDWDNFPGDGAFMNFLQLTVLQKFEEYNLAHPGDPMLEANGDPVIFL